MDENEIKAEYSKACSLVTALFETQLSNIKEKEAVNTWNDSNSSRFLHIYRSYVEKGLPRERYFERLMLEFPKIPRNQLDAQDRVVESIRWATKSRKNVFLDWERHKKALFESAKTLLNVEIEKLQEKMNKNAEFLMQEQKLVRINQEYAVKNKEFQAKLAVENEEKRAEEEKNRKEMEKKAEKRREYERKTKEKTAEFQLKRNLEMEKTRKMQEKRRILEESRKKSEIERNRVKIDSIRDSEMQKIHQKISEKVAKQELVERNRERMETVIAGYKHVPKLEVDPERVKKPTESKLAKKRERDEGDAVVLYRNTGFTAEGLMKDMRYRLAAALNEAGLAGTEYGKRMIREAPPATKPRSDMLSTFQQLG